MATKIEIVSVELKNGGDTLEVIKREPSNAMYACNPPKKVPDKLTKEIYVVCWGKIVLSKTEYGMVIPAEVISEKFQFDN